MSRLDLLMQNAGRGAGGEAPAAHDAALGLCIIAPMDPALTAWLDADLGLGRGDAVVVRLPGAALPAPDGDALDPTVARAVAAACFLHGCEEVLLLGVEDGGATRTTASAIDALRRAKVDRSTVPGADLRSFLGLVGDVRGALTQAAAALRATPFLPSRLAVHAALVDPGSGRLTVLESGYDKLRATAEQAADDRGPVALADPSLPQMPDRWTPDGAVAGGATGKVAASGATPAAEAADGPTATGRAPASGTVYAWEAAGTSTAGIDPRLAAAVASRRQAPAPRRAPSPRPAAHPRPASRAVPDDVAALTAPAHGAVAVDLAAGQVRFAGQTEDLAPEVLQAIQAVAYFLHDVYDDDERAMIEGDVEDARPRGGAAMIDALLQPLLHLGPERYRILNEMLVLKEQLVEMPDPVVGAIIREMLR